MLRYHNARVVILTAFVLVLVLAACAGEKSREQGLVDKARIVIDAEFGSSSVRGEGRQNIWIMRSSGWEPCPEMFGAETAPETCWIRVFIDDTQVAVVMPEPDGTFGPFPVAIHFDVLDFSPGMHEVWMLQSGRFEIRETVGAKLRVENSVAGAAS
jgi:hypothetical protein